MNNGQLEAALIDRDFERAQTLIRKWGIEAKETLKTALGDAARTTAYQNALSQAEAHLYLARVVRAQIALELEANSGSFLYRNTDLEQPHWRVNG